MALTLDSILVALRQAKQRATYGAVGGLLGRLPRSVMQGRPKNPAHSWVVLQSTGEPSGYAPAQMDPALHSNPQVITASADLRRWLSARTS
jgi:hypothetical protein